MTSPSTAETGLTRDAFLGGRLSICQPKAGYRAGVDPILLAAFATAQPGQSVLEIGCGVGVASLALQARVGGLDLTGLERQPDYAALARRNAADNGLALDVVEGDVARMPEILRARQFDHVIANPPYFRRGGTRANDAGREAALAEDTPLAVWIDAGIRRLRPGGVLSLIQRPERLTDILTGCDGRVGRIALLPLLPREGRAASLILLRAVKGARSPLRLLAPAILHCGADHSRDAEDYTGEISAILRDGANFAARLEI